LSCSIYKRVLELGKVEQLSLIPVLLLTCIGAPCFQIISSPIVREQTHLRASFVQFLSKDINA
jgi:hypothetical protein